MVLLHAQEDGELAQGIDSGCNVFSPILTCRHGEIKLIKFPRSIYFNNKLLMYILLLYKLSYCHCGRKLTFSYVANGFSLFDEII